MPKSKVRKKPAAPVRTSTPATRALAPSPTWYPYVMGAVLLIGLAYMVVYYLAANKVPLMDDIGAWNFAIGFGVMLLGLVMAVRWR